MNKCGMFCIIRKADESSIEFGERLKEFCNIIYQHYTEVVGVFPNYMSSGDIEYIIICR